MRVLEGGTAAWVRAGQPAGAATATNPPDEACIDFYLRPYDRNSGVEEAMRAYLAWEIDLVHEIERDGTVAFGVPGADRDAAARRLGRVVRFRHGRAPRWTCCCRRNA